MSGPDDVAKASEAKTSDARTYDARTCDARTSEEVDCVEVLTEVYLYLDLECSDERRDVIKKHLDECRPCLREYGIEQEVKALVARCCGREKAPPELRARLRAKLSTLVVDVEVSREPG